MKHFLFAFLFCFTSPVFCQTNLPFNILFWNVENLFDCKHDSLKNDTDFLPESLKHWNTYKYRNKLTAIAKGVVAAGEWSSPAIIGLCEVENDSVLYDLTQKTNLRNIGYRYVVTQSEDARGIDVALLYLPEYFRLTKHESLKVGKLKIGNRLTRDILHVEGVLLTSDTLDLFVAHFPSRFGGRKYSEPNRIQVAKVLRNAVDSLFSIREKANIVIMGDFNDYPDNRCVTEILNATAPTKEISKHQLYHLLARKREKYTWGTYKYKNEWGVLDHFIVSGNLLDHTQDFYTSEQQTDILKLGFLLIEDKKYGGSKPFRTYNGMQYQAGYSDHLPIRSTFTLKLED
ncbi:Endonuclease/exonuclease/phosphatase [Bacteroides coprosuis DSM 18011]|uniref:Endonuclease/exonuclease/phosphatase n=1 Tax=Bacteroides coprosuis DSM 18011 TaxID=679937 RepID=F3ZNT4_9BACE|nr:endonuclease/exonuclease/phosphatase family protein [Bacteroides coprosuis]EGJ71510.1 Endonuclease/exonuclease/phosphatase [Bacteroides coprosuis DSM 18011]